MESHHPILAVFERWVNGNLWLDDGIYMKKELHKLIEDVKRIIKLEEPETNYHYTLTEKKMMEKVMDRFANVGLNIIAALKTAKIPKEIEPYSPEFGHIGTELQEICVFLITNQRKIDVAASAWHKCCAEFFEEMWHQWFYRHGIYTKSDSQLEPNEDDKQPPNFNVMSTEQMLIDIFKSLIDERNWAQLKRQKLVIIYKIGNVLESALHVEPIKTLKSMHNCEGYGPKMMKMVKDFCEKNFNRKWTGEHQKIWRLICDVFIWENWLFNYPMLTEKDLKMFHDKILKLVGRLEKKVEKNTSFIEMNVVDKSVLNIIGQILVARVLIDHSGKTLIHFVNYGQSTICNFCANRTAQFTGWQHICVYNLWLFVCNELDKKAVDAFQGILRRMNMIRSIKAAGRVKIQPKDNEWLLMEEIATQFQQNVGNPIKLKNNLNALFVHTWQNLSIFCNKVAENIETEYGTFFPSWTQVCDIMITIKLEQEKAIKNNKNKTPKRGKGQIQKENKKEVSNEQKEEDKDRKKKSKTK
ncbi:hypothetical protein niasHT_039601 [Heterodera trifolii]|uniref:Uncharacterized protein n=1 Tax=Heterodera trifolii TaxID=157864 RepID=A0ABD2HZP9_9BILA